ncbi:MAG: anti-sigma factor [Vicinamibacteria bacterium]
MMTCRDLYGFLDEYLDGALDLQTRVSFAAHLALCSSCRKYLASYRSTLRVARDAELKDVPARTEAPEELIQAILAARVAAFVRQPPE